jgi:hypothetical protein
MKKNKPTLKLIDTKKSKDKYKKYLRKKLDDMVHARIDEIYFDVAKEATEEYGRLSVLDIEELVQSACTAGILKIVITQAEFLEDMIYAMQNNLGVYKKGLNNE